MTHRPILYFVCKKTKTFVRRLRVTMRLGLGVFPIQQTGIFFKRKLCFRGVTIFGICHLDCLGVRCRLEDARSVRSLATATAAAASVRTIHPLYVKTADSRRQSSVAALLSSRQRRPVAIAIDSCCSRAASASTNEALSTSLADTDADSSISE